MILDALFWLTDQVIKVMASILPSLPEDLLVAVEGLRSRMTSLVTSLPYSSLFPWSVLGVAVVVLPAVYGVSLTIRIIRRVIGWVRSRGTSDE